MSKVQGTNKGGGVVVIPLTRRTNPCIGLVRSQEPHPLRVRGVTGLARDSRKSNPPGEFVISKFAKTQAAVQD